jgi:valyl-tRNA synthetase
LRPRRNAPLAYTFVDQWIIGRLQQVEAATAEAFDTYRFDLAAQTLYEFVWNDTCDWYIELAKVQLQTGCPTTQRTTRRTLVRVLEVILRLLHPIMPFITEELWQTVAPLANAKHTDSMMLAAWPLADRRKNRARRLRQNGALQDLIGAVRNLRGEMGLAPGVKAPLFVEGGSELGRIAALCADDGAPHRSQTGRERCPKPKMPRGRVPKRAPA